MTGNDSGWRNLSVQLSSAEASKTSRPGTLVRSRLRVSTSATPNTWSSCSWWARSTTKKRSKRGRIVRLRNR